MSGKKKPYKGQTNNNELPLVDSLHCPKCGKVMTGSGSKGNGGVYHYYHCQRKYNCNNSFRASIANEEFARFLQTFQPVPEVLALYDTILENVFKLNETEREAEKNNLEKQIENIDKQLQKALEKNLNDVWDDMTYKQFRILQEEKKSHLFRQHSDLSKMPREFDNYKNYAVSLLGNLAEYYSQASTTTKKRIVGSIFPEKIYFENNSYRTTRINEVVALVFNVDKGLKQNSLTKIVKLSTSAPPV